MQMADLSLTNSVKVNGMYGDDSLTLTSNIVTIQVVNGITVKMSTDKEKWASGELTYTITITNNAEKPLETPVITDVLDTNLIKLVANSVSVDGNNSSYTYEEANGNLTINLKTIAVGSSSVITFRVQCNQW